MENKHQGWGKRREEEGGKRRWQSGCSTWLIPGLLVLIMIPWLYNLLSSGGVVPTPITYTAFRNLAEAGSVESVTIAGEQITGELNAPAETTLDNGEAVEYVDFVTYLPAIEDPDLMALLREQGVEIDAQPSQDFTWWAVLLNLLPFLFFIGLGYLLLQRFRSQGDNVLSMGKSRARLHDQNKEQVTFYDVAGAQGAKRELEEIISFLKDPGRYLKMGAKIPKGVLLVGPPGTGKTLLARAVAGEAGVPFFSITGSDFMEMFVGVGASRVRDLFVEAKKSSPAIIFIDELDSIGRRRGAGVGGGHDEREQTLNQMLSELDGFEPNENVIVMAATNRPDILDPALLRPGRFDRQITVDLPTTQDRLQILRLHARNKPLGDDVNLEQVARSTPGFSGADLQNLLNEAALLAARERKNLIENEDISEARDKVIMGLERENLALNQEEYRLLAYHEAGHAVVAAVLPHTDPVHKVTIVPRGRAMGVTQQLPERDRYLYPREYMLDRMAVMMGGRAAEELVLNTQTSGAENDFKQATRLARKMVLDWGMSERLGHVAMGGEDKEIFLGEDLAHTREYSEATAREVDQEVRAILGDAFQRAKATLQEHRDGLDRLVDALLEREVIHGEEVLTLLDIQRGLKPESNGRVH
jgi:cell division protease FtsH